MAKIIDNQKISDKIFLLTVSGLTPPSNAGQFYMIKPSNTLTPFLPRPISVFDYDGINVQFYCEIVGDGMAILSAVKVGEQLDIFGPYGNGFTIPSGNVTLIGGATGCAPLHYLAKLCKADVHRKISAYLGFAQDDAATQFMHKAFSDKADTVQVAVGGYVTDYPDYANGDTFFACGKEQMLKVLSGKAKEYNAKMYLSVDKRMACGVGACLGCTCKTVNGNRRACKDGPVFDAMEIVYE